MIPIQESRSTHPHTYNHFELNFPLPLSHLGADILAGLLSPQSTTQMINFNLLTSSMTSDGGEGCSLLSFHAHTHAHTHTCTHWRAKFKSVWVQDVFFFFVRDTPHLLCNLFVCTDSLLTLSVWPSLWWRPEWFILLSLTFQIAWKIHQSPD